MNASVQDQILLRGVIRRDERVLVRPGPRVDSRRVLPEVLDDQADCP